MKFLVTAERRQPQLPPDVVAGMLSAQRDWLNERLADGSFECVYGFIGGGGVGIASVDSHEQMDAMLVGSPAFLITDYDVRAVGDVNAILGDAIAACQHAAEMMPQPAVH